MLGADFFEQEPVDCARGLIGATFCWDGAAGIVVETEAYSETGDEACHTYSRPSARRFIEEHSAGAAYVYLNYGVHWLTNVLIKNGRNNGFVLLRALAPVHGIPAMRLRRRNEALSALCSGPGKLSQALGILGIHHGQSLISSPDRAFFASGGDGGILVLATGPRIGISRAAHLPWRFGLAGSPYLSAPFGATAQAPIAVPSSHARRDE